MSQTPDLAASGPVRAGLPWHWLIFLPVLASVVAGLTTLGIAIRHGDKPLPEMVTRTGPVLYGQHVLVDRARELGLSASARFDGAARGIVLELAGDEAPPSLNLRLWHPTEARRDRVLLLTRGDDGSYRGAWPADSAGMRVLLQASDQRWEIPATLGAESGSLLFLP